jgi:hypothetical protein
MHIASYYDPRITNCALSTTTTYCTLIPPVHGALDANPAFLGVAYCILFIPEDKGGKQGTFNGPTLLQMKYRRSPPSVVHGFIQSE